MDVEKALPRGLRKRFVPDKQIIRPNQYHGLKRYWYSPPITAEDIQTALNPKKVSVSCNASSSCKDVQEGSSEQMILSSLCCFSLQSPLVRLNDRTEELQETVTGLKNRMKTMQCNQEEIHKMLNGIVKKLEAIVEGDDDEDDQLFQSRDFAAGRQKINSRRTAYLTGESLLTSLVVHIFCH